MCAPIKTIGNRAIYEVNNSRLYSPSKQWSSLLVVWTVAAKQSWLQVASSSLHSYAGTFRTSCDEQVYRMDPNVFNQIVHTLNSK